LKLPACEEHATGGVSEWENAVLPDLHFNSLILKQAVASLQ
jgi:hypothetical protein